MSAVIYAAIQQDISGLDKLYRTSDLGATWEQIASGLYYVRRTAAFDRAIGQHTVYAMTTTALFRWREGEADWTTLKSAATGETFRSLIANSESDVWLSSDTDGTGTPASRGFVHRHDGSSWTTTTIGASSSVFDRAYNLLRLTTGDVLLVGKGSDASRRAAIWKWSFSSESWSEVYTSSAYEGEPQEWQCALPNGAAVIYLGVYGSGDLARATYNGASFSVSSPDSYPGNCITADDSWFTFQGGSAIRDIEAGASVAAAPTPLTATLGATTQPSYAVTFQGGGAYGGNYDDAGTYRPCLVIVEAAKSAVTVLPVSGPTYYTSGTAYVHALSAVEESVREGLIDEEDVLLFAKLDGIDRIFCERSDRGTPSGWSLTCLPVLEVPGEFSASLSVKEMSAIPSSMSFVLRNTVLDDDTIDHAVDNASATYYLAQLFAPGRWNEDAFVTYATKADANDRELEADATSINVSVPADTEGFDASGTAHLPREAFAYSSIDGSGNFQGVVKGVHSAIGGRVARFGFSYPKPTDTQDLGDAGDVLISSVPYSLNGRRIALYATTWSRFANGWLDEREAVLLWAGVLDAGITYRTSEGAWYLTASNALSVLDREVAVDLPSAEVYGYNLRGPLGAIANVEYRNLDSGGNWEHVGSATIAFDKTWHEFPGGVAASFCDAMNSQRPALASDLTFSFSLIAAIASGQKPFIRAATSGTYSTKWHVLITPSSGQYLPLLASLGLDPYGVEVYIDQPYGDDDGHFGGIEIDPPRAFAPASTLYNGGAIYTSPMAPIQDQGDNAYVERYYLAANGQAQAHDDKAKVRVWFSCSEFLGGISPSGVGYGYHTIEKSSLDDLAGGSLSGVIAPKNKPEKISQVFGVPGVNVASTGAQSVRGPFEQLLYVLLSTGSAAYNHATYDALAAEFGAGIQAEMIDVQSFLDADAQVLGEHPSLAQRLPYTIDEPISVKDLLDRECKLFGYVATWARGKLRVVRLADFSADSAALSLTWADTATLDESPDLISDTSNVINSWSVKPYWDGASRKYKGEIVIRDANSIEALGVKQELKLEHPGIANNALTGALDEQQSAELSDALRKLFLGSGRGLLRAPWPRVRISLRPRHVYELAVGDTVNVTFDRLPDPLGSGSMSLDGGALVIGTGWSYSGERRLIGWCELLIYPSGANYVRPWAPSALVDITATNGGWNNTTKVLTTVARQYAYDGFAPADATAFAVGDEVLIRRTNPSDPTSPTTYGPFAIDAVADNLITLEASATMASWSATEEHRITFADYGSATASMKTRGSWQAPSSLRLGSAKPDRWG